MTSLPKERPARSPPPPPSRLRTLSLLKTLSSRLLLKTSVSVSHTILLYFVTCILSFDLGQDIQPTTDLTRFVKWPEYVRLQRQKVILHQRLKVPPAIAQFSHTLDKNTATQLFKLLNKYRPETTQEKKARLTAEAAAAAEGKDKESKVCYSS